MFDDASDERNVSERARESVEDSMRPSSPPGESANLPRESLLAAREDAAMAAMPDHIPIPMPGGLDVDLPQFVKVRQHFANEVVADVDAAVAASFAALPEMDLAGKRIAIGVEVAALGRNLAWSVLLSMN